MSGSESMAGDGRPAFGDKWPGHFPIAHEVLLSILLRAAAGDKDFTRAERILYTTCEFWAAIQARSIVTHLGSKTAKHLRNAVVAFSEIGAVRVASTLTVGCNDLTNTLTTQRA